jgi:hypothetical protein
MDVRFALALAAALALSAEIPLPRDTAFLRSPAGVLRADTQSTNNPDNKDTALPAAQLQPESRLLLVRDVNGEYAKAVLAIPGGKKGFRVAVGKPVNPQKLHDALRLQGTAAGPGDTVQITNVEFREKQIVVDINGGPHKHFHLRDHLQVRVGTLDDAPPPPSHPNEGLGATLILDYGRPVPDMSPDQLMHDLSMVLDFSKQHSASKSWIDTLPPQFQQGVKDHHAVLGMDRQTVIAAMGRPNQKVRERDDNGTETEDWIYGTPPEKTTFVTFIGDTVIRIKDFNGGTTPGLQFLSLEAPPSR